MQKRNSRPAGVSDADGGPRESGRARSWPRVVMFAVALSIVAVSVAGVSVYARAAATPDLAPPRAVPPTPGVMDLTYSLGDDAMSVPGFFSTDPRTGDPTRQVAPLELDAEVYAPSSLGDSPHPLIVLAHGYWETCDDVAAGRARRQANRQLRALGPPPKVNKRGSPPSTARDPNGAARARFNREYRDAESRLLRWPCAAGTPQLASYRGFSYLGNALARQGFIVVSIGLNGVNAGELSGDDRARAAVIDRHLAMWATLDRTGRGPLAGHFTDAETGAPADPAFKGTVDLGDVGLLGHSRGGRGVMYAAAAEHSGQLPHGLRIRAVFGMAAAGEGSDSPAAKRQFRVRHAAVMTWTGTCDRATGTEGHDYNEIAATGQTTANLSMSVAGADHDFLNELWSPSSGEAVAYDDATHPKGHRHRCRPTSTDDGQALASGRHPSVAELTEVQERAVAATYVSAFFGRYLLGRSADNAILAGRSRPDARITTIRINRY